MQYEPNSERALWMCKPIWVSLYKIPCCTVPGWQHWAKQNSCSNRDIACCTPTAITACSNSQIALSSSHNLLMPLYANLFVRQPQHYKAALHACKQCHTCASDEAYMVTVQV